MFALLISNTEFTETRISTEVESLIIEFEKSEDTEMFKGIIVEFEPNQKIELCFANGNIHAENYTKIVKQKENEY